MIPVLDNCDEHLLVQLRKADDLRLHAIRFLDGTLMHVDRAQARLAMSRYSAMKTAGEREQFVEKLWASPESFKRCINA